MLNNKNGRHVGLDSIHYAWVVVISAAVITLITSSLRLSFGIFLDPLLKEFGWSHAKVSAIYSIQFIAFAFASIWAGYFSDRYGTKLTAIIGSLLFMGSMILSGRTHSILELYLYYGVVMGIGLSAFSSPLHSMISRWFDKEVGLALGVVTASQGLGGLVLAPLLRYVATAFHWQTAFIFTGVIGGTIAVLASLLLRNMPQDVGLLPYGHSQDATGGNKGNDKIALQQLHQAIRSRPFWILIAVHFLGCIGHSIPLVHVVSYATGKGVPGVIAASILGFISGFSILGRLGLAILAEKLGGKLALILTLCAQAVGALMFLVSDNLWGFFLAGIVFGLGFGGEMVIFPVLNRSFFHPASIGSIYGYQIFGAGIGMAAGGYFGGLIFDLTGTYSAALELSLVSSLLGAAAMLLLKSNAAQELTSANSSYNLLSK